MDRYTNMLTQVCAELDVAERTEREAKARRFLARLDPHSTEGMWFEAVAGSFPSRLDAAIAYVEAVGPAGPTT